MSWRENQLRIFTMPIIRTAQPFIKTDSNIFFDRTIPQTCRDIHSLVIDLLKIPGWIIRKKYIADRLQISLRTVNRYFNLLVKRGLAFYDMVKHRWHVFRTPKPNKTATSSEGGLPLVAEGGLPLLVGINQKDNYPEEKTTTPTTPAEQQKAVVVCLEEEKISTLVFPHELSEPQLKAAKHRIKLAPIDMQQAILIVLAANLAKGTVKNPIGYLNTLITAANNGTFEPVGAATATKPDTRHIETQERLKAARAIKRSSDEKAKGGFQQAKLALRGIL
jgi:hypothetical protein